jgi:hypothetical protein
VPGLTTGLAWVAHSRSADALNQPPTVGFQRANSARAGLASWLPVFAPGLRFIVSRAQSRLSSAVGWVRSLIIRPSLM